MNTTSLVVIQYGKVDLLKSLFQSLEGHQDKEIIDEVIVVNNDSKSIPRPDIEQLQEMVKEINKKFISNTESSYSSAVNLGVKESNGDIIIVSNNDIEWIKNKSIFPAIQDILRKDVGIVTPQLLYPDETWQRCDGDFYTLKSAIGSLLFTHYLKNVIKRYKYKKRSGYSQVSGFIVGAFFITTREKFNSIGGFDEQFDFYCEDVDFSFRMKKTGLELGINYDCEVIHIGGETTDGSTEYTQMKFESRQKFLRKHFGNSYMYIYLSLRMISYFEEMIISYPLYHITGNSAWKDRVKGASNCISGIIKSVF